MVRSTFTYLLISLTAAVVAGEASFAHLRGTRNHRRPLLEMNKEAQIVKDILGEEALKDRFEALIAKQNGEAVDTDDYSDGDDGDALSTIMDADW